MTREPGSSVRWWPAATPQLVAFRGIGEKLERRERDRHGFERMAERLDLTDEQRRQVREELAATSQAVHRLLDGSGDRIRALLDEDQRRSFDEMRHHAGRHRRRPPPGESHEGPPATPAPVP